MIGTIASHDLADIWAEVQAAAYDDDGAAADEHLAAGFPIYYVDADTPADVIVKQYPDGRRELMRFEGGLKIAA